MTRDATGTRGVWFRLLKAHIIGNEDCRRSAAKDWSFRLFVHDTDSHSNQTPFDMWCWFYRLIRQNPIGFYLPIGFGKPGPHEWCSNTESDKLFQYTEVHKPHHQRSNAMSVTGQILQRNNTGFTTFRRRLKIVVYSFLERAGNYSTSCPVLPETSQRECKASHA